MKKSVNRKGLAKFALWSLLTIVSGGLVITGSAYLYLAPSLPSVETLRDVKLQIPLRVFSRDNKLMAEFSEQRRSPVDFENLPKTMVQAFMAAEDDRFYEHSGVDLIGLSRAFVQLVSTGSIQSGGSTITMQVAKNFFLSNEQKFSRKFNEILLALQIEQQLEKNDIFELYLNKIYLGNRAYGVEAAAQVYYGKTVDELTLAETAMVAGLPKAPSAYNPLANPQRAKVRRNWILGRMASLGYITAEQEKEARAQPITASYHGPQIEVEAPYIAEMVRQQLFDVYGEAAYTDGFVVHTTIDSVMQEAANRSITQGLMEYNERHGYQGPERNLLKKKPNTAWQEIIDSTPTAGVLMPAMVTEVMTDRVHIGLKKEETGVVTFDNMKWAREHIDVNNIGPEVKSAAHILKAGDQIWVRKLSSGEWRLAQQPQAQSALISINPETGGLLALVGGYNFYESMYNRATQSVRQAGSSFKPFIYAAALANGMTAATMINDAPIVTADNQLEDSWRPNNDNMRFNGPTRLREGLYRSRNLVSIRVLREVGVRNTIEFLKRLGFRENTLARDLSLSLGNVSMTPLELVAGYSIIANGGYEVEPFFIEKIATEDKVYFDITPKPETETKMAEELAGQNAIIQAAQAVEAEPKKVIGTGRQLMSSEVNYIINSIMNDVVAKGTGRRALVLKRNDLGGKTGTTNDNKDVWFVGFNPNVLTAVWMGKDDYTSLGKWEYGANSALPIWINFMRTALKGKPDVPRTIPEGMVTLRINTQTGQLATENDDETDFEVFRQEYAPQPLEEGFLPSGNSGSADFTPDQLF